MLKMGIDRQVLHERSRVLNLELHDSTLSEGFGPRVKKAEAQREHGWKVLQYPRICYGKTVLVRGSLLNT